MAVSNKFLLIQLQCFFQIDLFALWCDKNPCTYSIWMINDCKEEESLATKDTNDALFITDFLLQRSRSERPAHPLRLFMTLHRITFTCESLFQLQLWNSAGFNHFFNHLDQNRNFSSYEKFSICSFIVCLYYKWRKGVFLNAQSPIYGIWDKFPVQKWTIINGDLSVLSHILIWFLSYFSWFFFSIAQHAFGNDYLKMEKKKKTFRIS